MRWQCAAGLINMDDAALEKLAREEILKEAKRGAARADAIGPTGWEKCPLPPTNKRFLQNTLFNVVGANKNRSTETKDLKRRKTSKNRPEAEQKTSKKQKIKEENVKDDKKNRRNSPK